MHRVVAVAVGLILVVGLALTRLGPSDDDLHVLAASLGFADAAGFVEVVETVRETGRLPAAYLTKEEAAALGWQPGSDLCASAPGRVIGGDRFFNREGRLPDVAGRVWFEADLDFACGKRGAKRLVFANDGAIYVTVDHYASFIELRP